MKHNGMQKVNLFNAFSAICNGCNTSAKLMKSINIGHSSVSNIISRLEELKMINISYQTNPENPHGRKISVFSVSPLNYSVFIEEHKECFSCIFINANLRAIERFDKVKYYSGISLKTVLERVENKIVHRDDFEKHCKGIYISCFDETAELLPDYFTRIVPEFFVAEALKTNNEINLFVFPKKRILSLYGQTIETTASLFDIKKVLNPDKIIITEDEFYEEIFIALQKMTIKKMMDSLLL